VATIAGAILGSVVGAQIGRSIDRTDEAKAMQALEYNRTGQASSWENPQTGNDVTVVPVSTYKSEANQFCREYQMTIVVEGRRETGYGTACRQPDGSWKTVS
jgi:surface antigen